MRRRLRLEQRDRPLEVRCASLGRAPIRAMTPARSCSSACSERIVGQLERALEVALRLGVGGQRRGALAGADEHLAGLSRIVARRRRSSGAAR